MNFRQSSKSYNSLSFHFPWLLTLLKISMHGNSNSMTVPEFSMTARTLFYIYIYSLHNIDKMSWVLMYFEVLVYRNNMCSAVKWFEEIIFKESNVCWRSSCRSAVIMKSVYSRHNLQPTDVSAAETGQRSWLYIFKNIWHSSACFYVQKLQNRTVYVQHSNSKIGGSTCYAQKFRNRRVCVQRKTLKFDVLRTCSF